jgi:uncharacterized protein YdeI (YjbR/CyaY-like superfamily)
MSEDAAPDMTAPLAPDGRPTVGPFDRAGWRAWLIDHHATMRGVYLVSWRQPSGQTSVAYAEAVEEALCVGWIDATQRTLDGTRSIQWFARRSPRSGWSRSNKERVERLIAEGLMLPAGLDAIAEAKRRGTWTMFDDVEDLVVPDDLAVAFAANPPARTHWDAFSKSSRRAILGWIQQAKRPETRQKRISETARLAARNEKANEWVPRDKRR